MKNLNLLLILLLFSVLSGCSNCNKCCDPIPPNPGNLYLSVKQHGQPYPDSFMNDVQMYYYQDGIKITDPNKDKNSPNSIMYNDTVLLQRPYAYDGVSEYKAPGIFSSYYVLNIVAKSGVHDFYLQFADGKIDTLNIEIQSVADNKITSVPCQCTHQITEIKINGKEMNTDSLAFRIGGSESDNSVYIIEK
ncbi:hypothetical protein F0919_05540 [Taibaiella lutea]|uniref:Lipoprotein n=1 Tax=Taibaiella lutea TaxID=2608001 RepID=A0A5M6CW48_9BACT|nr:hypothetical protein [Taibaiella lutea]KAA5537135.1 hypothetical protein F0919_05540 [Taibaiella lutea]